MIPVTSREENVPSGANFINADLYGLSSQSYPSLLNDQVLITSASPRSLRDTMRRVPSSNFKWVYLGQSIGEFSRVEQTFLGRGAAIDIAHRFHQTAEELRGPYLKYIYNLGRELNSLRWWITSIAYRETGTSPTFRQSCYLKLGLELVSSWSDPEPLVVVAPYKPLRAALSTNLLRSSGAPVKLIDSDRSLLARSISDMLSMLAHRVFFFAVEAYRILCSRIMVRRPYMPAVPTTLICSWATAGNLAQGEGFHRSFFGDLANELSRLGHQVAIAPMVLRNTRFRDALLRLRGSSLPILVPQRYLRFTDLVSAVAASCTRPPRPQSIPPLAHMDISQLVQEELRVHRISNQSLEPLLVQAVVRQWARLGLPVERIIYLYENQPWERALCWESRRSLPATALVGYQHARMPKMLLNWYLAPGEENDAPLPNRVVTVGQHTAGLMRHDGYKSLDVRVGGAIQLQGLLSSRVTDTGAPGPDCEATVLVGCSASPEETVELIELAAQLFSGYEGIKVLVKCHPVMPFSKVSKLIGMELPSHLSVEDEAITDLLQKSSVMVYSGSTVCVQALALGLPLVRLRPQFDFDQDPLEDVPDARIEAMGLDDLRQKICWVLEHREEYIAQQSARWRDVVEEMYGPVTEDSFRAFVE